MFRHLVWPAMIYASMLSPALSQTITLPAGFEHSPGPSNNAIPFVSHPTRYQQVYGAVDLLPMVGKQITSIAFRADERSGFDGDYAGGFEFPSLQIDASITPFAVDSLTADLDGNHGSNRVTVRTGTYTIPALEGDLEVNPFDYKIEFNTPFFYSGGNLLLEFIMPEIAPTRLPYVDAVAATDSVNRAYTTGFGPGVRVGEDSLGLVTQFVFVPEPGTGLLSLPGILSVGIIRASRSMCR